MLLFFYLAKKQILDYNTFCYKLTFITKRFNYEIESFLLFFKKGNFYAQKIFQTIFFC
jgi:hypothetical protein